MSDPLKKFDQAPEGYQPKDRPEIMKLAEAGTQAQAAQDSTAPGIKNRTETAMKDKFIANVSPLQQFMDDGSFLMPEIPAVFRAMQAMRMPEYIDYDYLLSLSGMAVRLAWQPGWAAYEGLPNQGVFIEGSGAGVVLRALDRVGAKYTVKTISETGLEAAKNDIMASLGRGIPVLLDEPWVYAAVLGYSGDDLYGVSVFADKAKRVSPHNYNRLEDWEEHCKSYILFEPFEPRAMDGDLLLDTIKTAVSLARTTQLESLGNAVLGTAAFDAVAEMMVWDEGFAPLDNHKKAKKNKRYEGKLSFPYERPEDYYRTDGARTLGERFWAGYCDFLCMLNGYSNFARFLDKYADLLPAHSERLREAVQHYSSACNYSGELWKYVTPNDKGVAKFKNKEVRYAFAAHMLRAKIFTVKAVEILEGILANWEETV